MNVETQVWQLMSRPVRRLSMNSRIRDAAEFLRRWAISGAPVTDVHGSPVGVFSLRDLAGHIANSFEELPVIDPQAERARKTGEAIPVDDGFHFERIDDARVSDLMTPGIISVDPDAPVLEAIRVMQQRAIHRIFVRRGIGPLLGVLTTMDVLRWVGGAPESEFSRVGKKKIG
ncbi:MAG TPA: CBS domain-containing protein [Planctomycetota bacterium]|nr:CBS domain-containing protein [Planctomycetota bacterium]